MTRVGATTFEVIHPNDLGEPEVAAWRTLQRSTPQLANPFLAPEFTIAVGRLQPRARVAVLSDGPQVVGFFPFERRGMGRGVPIAAGLTDGQGLVHAPGLECDPRDLLRACGLATWEFDHLVGGQTVLEPRRALRAVSPVMDLSGGYTAYLDRLSPGFVADLRRKRRKLERDAGGLRFVLDSSDPAALRTVMAWKSAQYQRTGRFDRFSRPWIVALVEQLLEFRAGTFSGLLSMLYAADEPIAGHFGLRNGGALSAWFPAYDARFRKYSPGLLQHLLMAEEAAAQGIDHIDMGRGGKEYKDALKSRDLIVTEGRVVRRVPAAALHWAGRAPGRWLRNTVTEHPSLFRAADRTLKRYGRFATAVHRRTARVNDGAAVVEAR